MYKCTTSKSHLEEKKGEERKKEKVIRISNEKDIDEFKLWSSMLLIRKRKKM